MDDATQKLVDRARGLADSLDDHVVPEEQDRMAIFEALRDLTAALEAMSSRVADRDALAAVIEEARIWSARNGYPGPSRDTLHAILSRTPSGVMAEHDAKVRAEVIDWIGDRHGTPTENVRGAREYFELTKGAE